MCEKWEYNIIGVEKEKHYKSTHFTWVSKGLCPLAGSGAAPQRGTGGNMFFQNSPLLQPPVRAKSLTGSDKVGRYASNTKQRRITRANRGDGSVVVSG